MAITLGTKLVIEHIRREATWRQLCDKSGIDPKLTKTYTQEELSKKTAPKKTE